MSDPNRFALVHLVRRPAQGTGAPPLLILLHGIGSNEHDLFSMAPYLDKRFLIVSARAPYPYQWGGYAWFELEPTAGGVAIDPVQAQASRDLILQFIGQVVAAYGADARRIYLMGFSQGAMISAWVALNRPDLVAGAVLMSGRIPDEMRTQIAPPEQLAGKPFLVIHGTQDTMLPVENGRASRAILERLPVHLTYREYPMGHEVNAAGLAEVVGWLAARLDE